MWHCFIVLYASFIGRGVRTSKVIQIGEEICEYGGKLLTAEEGEELEETSPSVYRYFFAHKGEQLW